MTAKIKNLIVRALTGIIFVGVLVSSFLSSSALFFCILFSIITGLSVWEFATIVNKQEEIQINPIINTVAGIYLFLAIFGFCSNITPSSVFIPYLILIIYLLISELYLKRKSPINNWAYSMLAQMYIALPLSLLNVLAISVPTEPVNAEVTFNGIIPLAVFLFLWANDTGAYCVGSLIGKRKLFPRISPNKSWEGSIGGGITAIIVSQVLATFVDGFTHWEWFGLAVIVVLFGTWGDLVESLLKRQLGIKDSGHILPGHGGMLDRFDSSLLAIPAAVVYLYTISLY